MSFYPGQRCICVDGDFPAGAFYGWEALPKKGQVYTIRDCGDLIHGLPIELVRLVEINNEPADYAYGLMEAAFLSEKFRPLSESRLDVFRQHLVNPPKEEELA